MRGSVAALEITGIDKSAIERIGGLKDGEISFAAWYNTVAGQSHPVLKAMPTTNLGLMYVTESGAAIGTQSACMVGKQMDYPVARAQDGSLAMTVQVLANGFGLEWCEMLTVGKRTDTVATNGASLDYGAVSTAFGLSAYLQVFSVTGTSVTITLEDSADNAVFAAISGAAFAAATPAGSPQTQRIQTATGATIRRYVRAVSSGTFSNAVFSVAFIRHLTSTL